MTLVVIVLGWLAVTGLLMQVDGITAAARKAEPDQALISLELRAEMGSGSMASWRWRCCC
jgi:hypothetical protein